MSSPDMAQVAEILYPTTSVERRQDLKVSELRSRYESLPDNTRELLLEMFGEVGPIWRPGVAFSKWERELNNLGRKVGSSADKPAETGESPEQIAGIGQSVSLATTSLLEFGGNTLERRAEQVAMAKDIAAALEQQTRVIVEAGTGIGKTLAYLAPLAIWALKSGETGIISTYTKVLQEQVLGKEVPFLRLLLDRVLPGAGDALSVEVVKGRGNYLCKGALARACDEVSDAIDASFLARVAVWASFTATGDRAEINLTDEQAQRFYLLSAANSRCSTRLCRWHRDDDCFLSLLRQRAQTAHIVVTNHALLVSERDRKDLLPKAWSLVVDEAHELESAATSVLSNEMPRNWIAGILRRIYRPGADRDYGIVTEQPEVAPELKSKLRELVIQTQSALNSFYDLVENFASEQPEHANRGFDFVRLSGGKRTLPDWKRISERWTHVRANTEAICDDLFELELHYLTIATEDLTEAQRLVEISGRVTLADRRLRERTAALDAAIRNRSGGVVSWLQVSKEGEIAITAAPLSVAEDLQNIWDAHRGVVLTSATLATEQGFDFLCRRIGFQSTFEARYMSPFDYANRTRLFLLTDMPEGSARHHNEAVAKAVVRLATAIGGRTMVLFTSFAAMRHVADTVRGDLKMAGLKLLVQGQDGSPAEVVEALRSEQQVVACGVASMWNGVDVSGDQLSQLIISKLPFPFTFHPVHEARAECYLDGFAEFTLPQTVLQFRQGFGRLMRRESDRGVIVVLDKRVDSKNYGRAFVKSVFPPYGQPDVWVQRATVSQAAQEISAFLDSVPIST